MLWDGWLLSQPLTILCCVSAWGLIFLLVLNGIQGLFVGVARLQRLHQIPCPHCQFFTGDYRLKCTVQPTIANSEQAIYCSDYRAHRTWVAFAQSQISQDL